ncbi:ABC transporter permease [Lactobacillus gigeriorum]|uniref:ABC superfamily ATP binding cassette transporter, permease protein n=1 Tax=Lactobacillus gigeriorum DSM 23908 = CRBIP 24.85 TaxID=1423751 RepID=I7J2U2_9LACO|nr:ABC transporter permease [Lactobacillus gigeriorum]KRN12823.1 ABC transporter [Lactobacillus gigeriorum DSM 23908 = CRBIP 24.85]CCI87087.1 ABC superfamily ATP binding cassette transporter, permease protein [Lactobacillus gigeriorum DSM 23908 = CRBIP 24.85]
MSELAKKRLVKNTRQSIKYLTLVFNDFFVLALIFLFGALMFWYAQALKQIPAKAWFYRPVLAVALWLPLLAGRLVTLFKKADIQFLYPQDGEKIDDYLKPMFHYSLLLPTILLGLMAGILYPFANVKIGLLPYQYLLLLLAAWALKLIELKWEKYSLNFKAYFSREVMWGGALLLLLASTYFPWLGIICLAIAIATPSKITAFDWYHDVEKEEARKDRVYGLFSMFTDVAEKQIVIKRRGYFDFLLPKQLTKETPNLYLYRRSLLRNPEYLNLVVRMTAFGILISWLVAEWKWALGLSALVSFLTVYQLLPLAKEFDQNIMYRIMPIDQTKRAGELVQVLALVLEIQWLVISLTWLLVLPLNTELFIAIVGLLTISQLLARVYLPIKVKQ